MTAKDSARILAPPPLIYAAFLALGFLARDLLRWELVPAPYNWSFGFALVFVGLLLVMAPAAALLQARTALNPYHPTTTLLTNGIFRLSRNPIYLGFTAAYIGICVAFNLTVAILLSPLILVIMHHGVILREEAYLERKFGDEYLQYKASVRRWL
jgi:protein-S-isoprenylcysteine O-methyltransferase Ste14